MLFVGNGIISQPHKHAFFCYLVVSRDSPCHTILNSVTRRLCVFTCYTYITIYLAIFDRLKTAIAVHSVIIHFPYFPSIFIPHDGHLNSLIFRPHPQPYPCGPLCACKRCHSIPAIFQSLSNCDCSILPFYMLFHYHRMGQILCHLH